MIRIGPRFNCTNCELYVKDVRVQCKSDLKYLGINLLSGKTLKCNLQPVKQKFYRAVNGILGKIISTKNPSVVISLINSCALSILLYGLEALNLTISLRNTIDFVYNSVFVKLFNTKDSSVIKQCQYYTENFPATCILDMKKLSFDATLSNMIGSLPFVLNKLVCGHEEQQKLCEKYSIPPSTILQTSKISRKLYVHKWFEECCNN